MKIINARTGSLQTIPFTLGQPGRGRHAEEIKVSNRPGQEPTGPEDVSYFTFGSGGSQHCILTRGDHRRGILLRIDTAGVYTRGSSGRISLVGGQATCLASGQWAEGIAGNVGGGSDELWHVEGPALLEVVIQGGAAKGLGLRYLVVGRSMMPRLLQPEELVQMIATDGDPDVTETVRAHAALIGTVGGDPARGEARREEIASAIRLADQLEEHEPTAESASVVHFTLGDIRASVTSHGIAIPVIYADAIGGVSGVQAGTLVPGTQALLSLSIGPGGGKRYDYRVVSETGVRQLHELSSRPYTSKSVLYLVEDPSWSVAWVNRRDGADAEYTIADAGGIHTYTPAWADGIDGGRRTQAWPGLSAGPSPDFGAAFPALRGSVATQQTAHAYAPIAQTPSAPAQVGDLAARFNRR